MDKTLSLAKSSYQYCRRFGYVDLIITDVVIKTAISCGTNKNFNNENMW